MESGLQEDTGIRARKDSVDSSRERVKSRRGKGPEQGPGGPTMGRYGKKEGQDRQTDRPQTVAQQMCLGCMDRQMAEESLE